MQEQKRVFGRLENPDPRDKLFSMSHVASAATPELRQKYWWADGWWGNQGTTSHCVAYSWLHLLEDGPVVQDSVSMRRRKPLIEPIMLYRESQLRDPWPSENYNGTSIRAAAKVLKDLGAIKEYRWATSITEVVNTILTVGPMVVGTKWYSHMNNPDHLGRVRPSGSSVGGHAYVLNGVNVDSGMLRIKNSWGTGWGKRGYAFIHVDEFEKLLVDGGDACIAFEQKLTEALDWTKLRAPGVYVD